MVGGFESFANSERYKTNRNTIITETQFESFANSERYKTHGREHHRGGCLRALLIQKDTKQ